MEPYASDEDSQHVPQAGPFMDTSSVVNASAAPAVPGIPVRTVGRRDVQFIFALIATSIMIFGLLPLIADFLGAPGKRTESTASVATPVFVVDINSATASELALLPQVGPVLAERIVAERIAGGPFQSVDELSRTRGVGADRINRLRALIVAKPVESSSKQATYRAAKMPTDGEHADLIITPHSELLFKRPADNR